MLITKLLETFSYPCFQNATLTTQLIFLLPSWRLILPHLWVSSLSLTFKCWRTPELGPATTSPFLSVLFQ